jgi:hypothetical protein
MLAMAERRTERNARTHMRSSSRSAAIVVLRTKRASQENLGFSSLLDTSYLKHFLIFFALKHENPLNLIKFLINAMNLFIFKEMN